MPELSSVHVHARDRWGGTPPAGGARREVPGVRPAALRALLVEHLRLGAFRPIDLARVRAHWIVRASDEPAVSAKANGQLHLAAPLLQTLRAELVQLRSEE